MSKYASHNGMLANWVEIVHGSRVSCKADETMCLVPNPKFMSINTDASKFT